MSVGLYSGVSGLALGTGLYKNVSGLWSGASGLTAGFGGGSPFGGASLYLDFLAGAPLDSRVTFSRGSNATLVDSTGKITYAPANLITYSEQLDNAAWVKSTAGAATAPTVTANNATAPNGTTTADTVAFSVSGTTSSDQSIIEGAYTTIFNATAYAYSVWVKAATVGDVGKTIRVYVQGFSSGTFLQSVVLTDAWQRVTGTATSGATSGTIGLRAQGNLSQNVSVQVWGAQLEPVTYQTTPGTYNATTSAAYYGPRFDYDPVTLAAKGLLIEEQRTNLVIYSSDFTNASWTKSLSAMAGTFTTAPDGTNTGAKWREDNTLNEHAIYATPSLTAALHTETWYLKAAERTKVQVSLATAGLAYGASVIADLSAGTLSAVTNRGIHTGATATISSAGNGWYRVSLTITATAATYYPALTLVTGTNTTIYTGDGTSGIFIWGAQVEAGAFATSYIPTVASTVTRSADVASMTGTNFSSWYNQTEGTFVVGSARLSVAALDGISASAYTDANNNIELFARTADNRLLVFNGGAAQVNLIDTGKVSAGVPFATAAAYALNNYALTTNGGTVLTDTSATVPTAIALGIGSRSSNLFYNGHIRQIAYYNTRLTNAQLQTLTAPPLTTTLSMSFTNQAYTVGV